MKWIFAMDPSAIASNLPSGLKYVDAGGNVAKAFSLIDRTKTPLVVVCGSLYLVADAYRLLS